MPRRTAWLTALVFGGLVVTSITSGLRLAAKRAAASTAQCNLADCKQLARKIDRLKIAPAQESLHERSQEDLAHKIEQAAQLAKIPGSAILSINPQPGRRLGNSSLSAQPTNVQLRDVPLKQLVKFLIELSADESGLQPTSLRLTAPRTPPGKEALERWSVELVLTYLVFSPEYAPAHSGDSRPALVK